MKYSELFEPEPENWGLRGDPFLWQEMKEYFGDKEIPDTKEAFEYSLIKYCSDRCKVDFNTAENVYIEDFANGGFSSGEVCCTWWRYTGFPLLLSRSSF